MKYALAYTTVVALLVSSALAVDDHPLPADPAVTASVSAPAAVPPAANALPSAPAPTATAIIKLKPVPAHKFFDVRNTVPLGLTAIGLTADAVSTQKGLAYQGFHEINPVARPFVQTRTGAAVYMAGSFGLVAGAMYLAHKKNHHKIERFIPLAVAGWEGLLSFRNYRVIDSHR